MSRFFLTDHVVDWENRPLEAGNYLLEMTVTVGETSWEWEEPFEITEEDKELNVQAVELEEESSVNWWLLAGLIVLFLIIIALLVYIQKLRAKIE